MRLVSLLVLGMYFTACSHAPQGTTLAPEFAPTYGFAPVGGGEGRAVNAEPVKEKKVLKAKKSQVAKAEEKKMIAVYPCANGANCEQNPTQQKVVTQESVAAQVQQEVAKNKDIVDRQQRLLARGISSLKEQKKTLIAEKAYYDREIKTQKLSSLKPVMDNFKASREAVSKDIAHFDAKIQQFEKDLNYLQNSKGIRLGYDQPTEKLMEMIVNGQWNFGQYLPKEQNLLGPFFQKIGQNLAQN